MISLILEAAVRSLLAGAAAWTALKVLRIHDLKTRKTAALVVLMGALLMPVMMRWRMLPVQAERVAPARIAITRVLPVVASSRVSIQAGVQALDSVKWRPREMALALYAGIAVLLLLRLMVGLAIAFRIWRRAHPIYEFGPRVRISAAVASPVTIGFGIVLPAASRSWDQARLRMVLAHERRHVEEGDFFLQLLAGVHTALFWFSPLGWWMQRELAEVAEAICDQAGIEHAQDPSTYAELLLEFAAQPRRFPAGVAMAQEPRVGQRIDRILNGRGAMTVFSGKRRAALSLLAVILVILAAGLSIQLKAQNAQPSRDRDSYVIVSGDSVTMSDRDSYVIVSGDSVTMSGSNSDMERARALQSTLHRNYIWFERDGKEYVIDDPALVKQAQAFFQPQEELGRKQEELGEAQEKLGEQQEKLGELQSQVKVAAPDLEKELARLEAELKKLQASANKELTQDELSDIQSRIGDVQSKFGDAQAQAGEKESALGEKQSKLGEMQSELGEKQSKLGEEQSRLGEKASRDLSKLIEEAIRSGKARRTEPRL